jgi:outer membrane protein OmpA-like peptidoglycan-associated protein
MLAAFATAAFVGVVSSAWAQTTPAAPPAPAPAAAAPTANDYADALMQLDCQTCEGKVENLRGFSLATPGAARPTAPAAAPAAVGRSAPRIAHAGATPAREPAARHVSAADLQLNFRRGSAELTVDGEANARTFAQALNDPRLAGQAFLIVGHTDATGSRDVNLKLSQARAEAVKTYLVRQGVAADRLEAKGVGSQDLAVPSDPAAAANRRVEVRRAG